MFDCLILKVIFGFLIDLDFLCGIVIFMLIVVVFCCLWFKMVCLNLFLDSSIFFCDNFWIILLIMLFLVFFDKCGLISLGLMMFVSFLIFVILVFWFLVWVGCGIFFVVVVLFGGVVLLSIGDVVVIFFFRILMNRVVIRDFVIIVIKNIKIWLIVLSIVMIGLLCVILFFILLIIVIIEFVIEFVIILGMIWRGFCVVNGMVFLVMLKSFIVNVVFFIFFCDVLNFFFLKNVVILRLIGGI